MPRKKLTLDGKPIHRVGYRLLTSTDDAGKVHPVLTIEETMEIVRGSRDLVERLAQVGVIRTVQAESRKGSKLFSRLDAEAVADQLYGSGKSAEIAVGLKPGITGPAQPAAK